MKDEQLYIDGELADIDENTKITLNYKSNLFRDVTKIVSNNSYTVKLPKTVRNMKIFKHVKLDDRFPYKEHSVKYLRSGVEVIKNAAFNCCDSLEWVFIPASVEEIEDSAFNHCVSLTDVYYAGSWSDWDKIEIAGYNKCLTSATFYFDTSLTG